MWGGGGKLGRKWEQVKVRQKIGTALSKLEKESRLKLVRKWNRLKLDRKWKQIKATQKMGTG